MTLDTYLSDQTEWLLKRLTGNTALDREYVKFTLQRVAEQVAADVAFKGDEAAPVKNVKLNNR